MSSLISDTEKAVYSYVIDDLHDTFKKNILVIQEIANVNISNLDENYDSFSDKKDSHITYSAIETTISARVYFLDKAESAATLIFPGGGGDGSAGTSIPLSQNYGLIRIKTEKQYDDLIKNSTKIIIDGEDCQLASNSTRKSLFNLNYSTFYLMRHS